MDIPRQIETITQTGTGINIQASTGARRQNHRPRITGRDKHRQTDVTHHTSRSWSPTTPAPPRKAGERHRLGGASDAKNASMVVGRPRFGMHVCNHTRPKHCGLAMNCSNCTASKVAAVAHNRWVFTVSNRFHVWMQA